MEIQNKPALTNAVLVNIYLLIHVLLMFASLKNIAIFMISPQEIFPLDELRVTRIYDFFIYGLFITDEKL